MTQLVERLLLTPEICSLNPVHWQFSSIELNHSIEKIKIKEKIVLGTYDFNESEKLLPYQCD